MPDSSGGGVRIASRTNVLCENFLGELKHDERQRSGRKNLGQDLEHLPAEAALARNLEHDDQVKLVCGSLDQHPAVFAELDRGDRERQLDGQPVTPQDEELEVILLLASVSLSPADRRLVRTEQMDRRIAAAA